MKPQTMTVLMHLKNEGYITPLIARGVYGVESLAKRVSELRLEYNYPIKKILKKDQLGKRYMEYYFDSLI